MEHLYTKALKLLYFTVGYNILEGIISIIAGAYAGSIALVGFGLDSLGLGFNYLWGLWQADPIVGIIVALYLVKEGREIVTGEED